MAAAAVAGGAGDDVGDAVEDLGEVHRPVAPRVDTRGRPLVYLDLETTGLGRHSHITQIAARRADDDTFSRFVLPRIPIEKGAQDITGITCHGDQMYHRGNPVESVGIREALNLFLDFLGDRPVVVVGHNIKAFDCPILLNAARACGSDTVDRLQDAVHGFVDTLPLFRQVNKRLKSHSLGHLHEHYLGRNHDSHDAREDARALQEIVDKAKITRETLSRHSFTLTYITEVQGFHEKTERLLQTWRPLVEEKVVSENIAKKAASSGLSFDDVRRAFAEGKEAGAKRVLQQPTPADGKARVTDRRNILDSICRYLRRETERQRGQDTSREEQRQ